MSDSLRARIGAVQLAHMPDDYQRDMGECPCGFKYQKWSELASHVADAVIKALGSDCIYRYVCAHMWARADHRTPRPSGVRRGIVLRERTENEPEEQPHVVSRYVTDWVHEQVAP